jgi:cell division protein ZapA (FtsZ GTPase activity inhibitor)
VERAAEAVNEWSPAAAAQAEADEQYREWLLRPLMARLFGPGGLEARMTQVFDELRAAQASLGGEGGEIDTAATRVITAFNAAIGTLNSIATGLRADLTAANEALAAANAQLAAGQQVASETTATIRTTIDRFNDTEQRLTDAASALEPAPAPTP